MTTALQTLTSKLASRLEIGDGAGLIDTLKATAFKGQVTDAQMTALIIVANQYSLNPWTKEIYAFPDKNNGIVPVVGVDGWSRIINSNDKFDGMEFEQDEEKCTCIIFRKDRSHPIKVTEYMSECKRPSVGPWQSHPKRMLRHKAMIQCARLAFGFGGIYDQDEAERIVEINPGNGGTASGTVIDSTSRPALDAWPQDKLDKQIAKWRESGTKSEDDFITMLESRGTLTDEQKQAIRSTNKAATGEMTAADIAEARARELSEAGQ